MAAQPQDLGPQLSLEADAIVRQATEEARDLGQQSVKPEHVLLALLLDAESPTAQALRGLRLTYDRVREVVGLAEVAGRPPSAPALEWSRAALLVLERAADDATYRGAERVRPAHLLVALDPFEESIARVFAGLRPRLRPHDFVKAARSVPGLDEP